VTVIEEQDTVSLVLIVTLEMFRSKLVPTPTEPSSLAVPALSYARNQEAVPPTAEPLVAIVPAVATLAATVNALENVSVARAEPYVVAGVEFGLAGCVPL
jgi:hypothetical protein